MPPLFDIRINPPPPRDYKKLEEKVKMAKARELAKGEELYISHQNNDKLRARIKRLRKWVDENGGNSHKIMTEGE